jgi:molecular chaperone GrpE (heat shock protein)
MINFEAELDKLLSHETRSLPQYEFAELLAAGREVLAAIGQKQGEVSLQVEEIYDLVKEQKDLRETVSAEKTRADRLVLTAIGLCDLLEDFCAYARRSGSEELKDQARLLRENAGGILSGCGILRFGEEGQPLNPQIHTVKASAASPLPREEVVEVLQSGYVYKDVLIRKAAVVVSRGQEEEAREETAGTWNEASADWNHNGQYQYAEKITNDEDEINEDEIEFGDYRENGDTRIGDWYKSDQDEGEQDE